MRVGAVARARTGTGFIDGDLAARPRGPTPGASFGQWQGSVEAAQNPGAVRKV